MPHISVKLYPGRSQEMKENLAHKLQECLASESGCWSNDDISVSFAGGSESIPADFFLDWLMVSGMVKIL